MEQQKEQLSIMKAKIKNSWIYKNNWIIGIIAIIIVSIVGVTRSDHVEKNGIYSIAYVYHIEGTRGGLLYRYYYYNKGEKYNSHAVGSYERKDLENKRFYIQFSQNNPERCLIYTNKPVPSCIEAVPFDGWESIPTKCDD